MSETQAPAASERRGRGPTKPYPPEKFEVCLTLASAIREHGFDDSIRRTLVLQKMGKDLNARTTRDLITNAGKYGLITGSYAADNLALTEAGKAILDSMSRRAIFNQAVERIGPYKALYERLKDRRIPALDVLETQVTGVPDANRRECVSFFLENSRYLGLVYQYQGGDHCRPIEQAIEELGETIGASGTSTKAAPSSEDGTPAPTKSETPASRQPDPPTPPKKPEPPNMHLDINIHIDANASPEVIDQVFASMARHLYNRE